MQQALAKKAVVRVKTIHRTEGGPSNIVIETYETIFKALNIKAEECTEKLSKASGKEKTLV